MKYLLVFLFSFSFGQEVNIKTEFILRGDLMESLSGSAQRFTQFKKRDECVVLEYLGRNNFKVKYRKWIGYVKTHDLYINDEIKLLVKVHEDKQRKIKEENEKLKELEAIELIRKLDEEKRLKKIKEDSILEIKIKNIQRRKELEAQEKIESKKICHYIINEIDEFDNVLVVKTYEYSLTNNLYIELYKKGKNKYIFFRLLNDIGCASPYNSDKSFVKVKLENNDILTFYHSWDIDCNSFNLKADLSQSDILRLKKSPIKSVRLQGTDYYHDVSEIEYKEFFIDKLKCIE